MQCEQEGTGSKRHAQLQSPLPMTGSSGTAQGITGMPRQTGKFMTSKTLYIIVYGGCFT